MMGRFLFALCSCFMCVVAYADNLSDTDMQSARSSAKLMAQLDDMREQIKELRGDLEKLQFQSNKLDDKFAKSSADLEYRLGQLEKSKSEDANNQKLFENIDSNLDNDVILQRMGEFNTDNGSKQSTQDAEIKKDPVLAKKIRDKQMEQEYQDCYSTLKAGNYKKAREDFREFIKKYPDVDLVGSARYWIGETLFNQGEYEKAAVEYLQGYQAAVRGLRAPDNLLKLSKSLASIDHRSEACLTLSKLAREFPNAQSSINKERQKDWKALKCK